MEIMASGPRLAGSGEDDRAEFQAEGLASAAALRHRAGVGVFEDKKRR